MQKLIRREKDQKKFGLGSNYEKLHNADKTSLQKSLRIGYDTPTPNTKMQFGINILAGKPPYEGIHGQKIVDFNNANEIGYVDISDIAHCEVVETSSSVTYSLSQEGMSEQSSNEGFGFDAEIDIAPPGSPISTTAKFGFAYAKSKKSMDMESKSKQGYSYMFQSYGYNYVEQISVHWDNVQEDDWNDAIKEGCKRLYSKPSHVKLFQFFKNFGTHGLSYAKFGKICTSLVTMKGEATLETMQSWAQNDASKSSSFLWFQTSNEGNRTEYTGEVSESNFTYSSSSKECFGSLVDSGSCMKEMDKQDVPEILEWKTKPIWEMNIPGFRNDAKKSMESLFKEVLEAAVKCGYDNCSGNGSCAPSGKIGPTVNDCISFDTCICIPNYAGEKCERMATYEYDVFAGKTFKDGSYQYYDDLGESEKGYFTLDNCKEHCTTNVKCKSFLQVKVRNSNYCFFNEEGQTDLVDSNFMYDQHDNSEVNVYKKRE